MLTLAFAGLALACSLLTVWQVYLNARDIAETRARIDRAEHFIADCINPDGDGMIITLIRE